MVRQWYNFIETKMRPTKTAHSFQVGGEEVRFSSNFDSGNLRTVTQVGVNDFLVQSALDSYEMPVSEKSFFHFKVEGYPLDTQINITIPKLSLLSCIKPERRNRYRPCYSYNGVDYIRFEQEGARIVEEGSTLHLYMKLIICKPVVYFAFSLPYSYERYLNMIRDLPDSNKDFYLKKEVLCYSKNLHLVYMVSITSYDRRTKQGDQIGSANNGVILPEKHLHQERAYFDKPVILLSARVHPGESPSSWAIEGILKFLIGSSQEAKILRKHFLIVIVPMLNPDGVYEGLYRLDTLGHNLNRYYLISDNRQPSIYSMKHLIKHYHASKRLLFYFDFHGHPSFKGSFMYGNAIDDIAYQAETELFGRIMSLKCPTFEEKYCIFDREQMSSKDRHDMYTKEGCARVYAFRTASILHSYTIEMGFHGCTSLEGQDSNDFQYSEESYYQEGVSVLLSVLEAASLLPNSSINKRQVRKQIAREILVREQRFRKEDKNLAIKKKNVNETIENEYWKPIMAKFMLPGPPSPRKFSCEPNRMSPHKKPYLDTSPSKRASVLKDSKLKIYPSQALNHDSIKTIESTDLKERIYEMFELQTRKNIEAKDIMFSSDQRRRLSLNPPSKNGKPTKPKSVLDHILPKSVEKPERRRKEIRILSDVETDQRPIVSTGRKQAQSEQVMFGDMSLREETPYRTSVRLKDAMKCEFSFIPASKYSGKTEGVEQIFSKEGQCQLSYRRMAKTHKKYLKFFNLN